MRRPSLLTPAQQAEADRNRILSTLEHGGSASPLPAASRKRWLFAGLGAGALVLAGAAVVWSSADTKPATPRVVSATPAPPAQQVAPAPADVAASTAAATIHEEVPAEPVLPVAAASATGAPAAPASSADAPGSEQGAGKSLHATLEQPQGRHGQARPAAAPAKTKARPVPHAAQPTAQPDSDMALLSALVAHVQANEPASDDGAIKDELQACHRLKSAKARQCRAEVCGKHAKNEKECKAKAAQAAKES